MENLHALHSSQPAQFALSSAMHFCGLCGQPAGAASLAFVLAVLPPSAKAAADLVIADFEGADYGQWKVDGEAFGAGPARGTLPNQMRVSGFEGKALVNSFNKGDDTTGKLTSPAFTIERPYVNFLIGGGAFAGETCMNLLIDGKPVRTATGPNNQSGGSEALEWQSWDVREFAGRNAVIEIVDARKGGWGHINVDHIVQSDRKLAAELVRREFKIERQYLHLPVRTGAPQRRMKFVAGDHTVREFEIELAAAAGDPIWFSSDVSSWKGKTLSVEAVVPGGVEALSRITQSDEAPGASERYREKYRPQFHFTSRRGWHNDPNGMVYFEGEWHLYYQHNPYGVNWGNMHWAHAVSRDLVHWKELEIALYPKQFGDWAFSGSAVVDWKNTSGFGKGDKPPLVGAYTSTGRGECIIFSNNRGRTWTEYEGNPVVKHSGRDPRLLWHEPAQRWIMAIYDEPQQERDIVFYSSPDLKRWEYQSRIKGFFECPDFFELPVDGDVKNGKWVLYAADGKYMIGSFDGKEFKPESGKHPLWFGNFYAAQTFSDSPDGRRIQVGWGQGITFPGMPFNQQMTVPVELTLRTTDEGARMFARPVKEIDALHRSQMKMRNVALESAQPPLDKVNAGLLRIRAQFDLADATSCGFVLRGIPVSYDTTKQMLSCGKVSAPLKPLNGNLLLDLLLDRGSIEVFANEGRVALSVGIIPVDDDQSIKVFAEGGNANLIAIDVMELNSAWK